ncbi:polymeric immunoglobulin receptor [Amia ocellicauda]|uniref:polymeric immunoglobulin receptor n=1 Tax=Amia ocellicauda TaxID=2972642 RepID=UPI0034649759
MFFIEGDRLLFSFCIGSAVTSERVSEKEELMTGSDLKQEQELDVSEELLSLTEDMALIVLLLLASFPGGDAVSTLRKTSVLRGASVTIPCHYEDKYKSRVKYWCSGYYWTSCESLKRTDSLITQSDKVSISDDPAQGVFTVTMRGLKTGDTGWYWCAVEIGGYGTPDDRASLYLTVTEDAGVPYVVNATVTGQIGGEVSVQCHYGHPYRSRQKQWCRSGDWSSCQTAGSPGTAGHGSVLITDHTAEGLFSVTVSGLRPEDQGWYWCDIGDQCPERSISHHPLSL